MNLLIIDDSVAATSLAASLGSRLPSATIRTASPNMTETPKLFADRVANEIMNDWSGLGVVLVNASIVCGSQSLSSCPGLSIIEYLSANKLFPSIVLSFFDDPVAYSSTRRLLDKQGAVLLGHNTVISLKLPADTNNLVNQIKIASLSRSVDPNRPQLFRDALSRQTAAAIRHRLRNLQAALRMLEGANLLNLLNRDV